MKKKGKLKKVERLEIKILLDKEYSQRRIAKALDRSPNTISYEIKKNSVCSIYNPHKAQTKISWRRTHVKRN
jgi:IS30 family transposase